MSNIFTKPFLYFSALCALFSFFPLSAGAAPPTCTNTGTEDVCVQIVPSADVTHSYLYTVFTSNTGPTSPPSSKCSNDGGVFSSASATLPPGGTPGVRTPLLPGDTVTIVATITCVGGTEPFTVSTNDTVQAVHVLSASISGPSSFTLGQSPPPAFIFTGGYVPIDTTRGISFGHSPHGGSAPFRYRTIVTPPAPLVQGVNTVYPGEWMSTELPEVQCTTRCQCQYRGPTCCGDPSTCSLCGTFCNNQGPPPPGVPQYFCWNFLTSKWDQINQCEIACNITYEISYQVQSNDTAANNAFAFHNVDVICPVPPPLLHVFPTSHNYGQVEANSAFSKSVAINVTNIGGATLNGDVQLSSGFSHFRLSDGVNPCPCTYSLAPGDLITYTATFQPTALGIQTANIAFTSTGGDATVNLIGEGVTISINAVDIDFGGVKINTTKALIIQVINNGSGLIDDSFQIVPQDYSDSAPPPNIFACVEMSVNGGPWNPGCPGFAIDSGENVRFRVEFTPDLMRHYLARMQLTTRPDLYFNLLGHGLFITNFNEF